jgi:crossover junction endodeoxyribonuclease RusA
MTNDEVDHDDDSQDTEQGIRLDTEGGWRIAGELVLPWPELDLSPNTASHWRVKAKAKALYRERCNYIALHSPACQKARAYLHNAKEARLVIAFYPPTARSYDLDNLLARMKSGLDGLADAWGYNDKIIKSIEVTASGLKGSLVKLALYIRIDRNE